MLTGRLDSVIKHVNATVAADIGTDHAYVSTELIKKGRARKVIASDINIGPLNAAKINIEKNDLAEKIETRLGNGLSVLNKNEADTIIIAGMGGELISEIISNNTEIAREATLILQPMNSQAELRRYLIDNSFTIIMEDIECEGKRVYNILKVINGKSEPFINDIDYHLPKYLYKHPKFPELLDKKQREFKKITIGLRKSKECDNEKLKTYEKLYNESEEIRKNACK